MISTPTTRTKLVRLDLEAPHRAGNYNVSTSLRPTHELHGCAPTPGYCTDLASDSRRRLAMPARSLREKPGTSSMMPANSRWPSTTSSTSLSATTVALRGALSSRASSPKAWPGPEGGDPAALAGDLGGALQEHEELVPGLALGHEDLAGRDPDVFRPAGDQLEVFSRAGAEKGHLLEVVDEGVTTGHGAETYNATGPGARAALNSGRARESDTGRLKLYSSDRSSLFRSVKRSRYVQGRRDRPRHHQLGRRCAGGRRARRHPQRRRAAAPPHRSSRSRRRARCWSARSPSARPSPTRIARSAR